MQDDRPPRTAADKWLQRQLRHAVLHDDDRRVLDRADGDAETRQRKEVDRLAETGQRQYREERAQQQNRNRTNRGPEIPQEQDRDQNEHDQLGQQRSDELLSVAQIHAARS